MHVELALGTRYRPAPCTVDLAQPPVRFTGTGKSLKLRRLEAKENVASFFKAGYVIRGVFNRYTNRSSIYN